MSGEKFKIDTTMNLFKKKNSVIRCARSFQRAPKVKETTTNRRLSREYNISHLAINQIVEALWG